MACHEYQHAVDGLSHGFDAVDGLSHAVDGSYMVHCNERS